MVITIMFKVMNAKCSECLFSKHKIVSDERRLEILKTCSENDSHFICHKASIVGEAICCRGFYNAKSSNLIRISGRLNMIEFVPVPDQK